MTYIYVLTVSLNLTAQHDILFIFIFLKHVLSTDAIKLGYTDDYHCKGQPHRNLPGPQRLQWNIPPEVGTKP